MNRYLYITKGLLKVGEVVVEFKTTDVSIAGAGLRHEHGAGKAGEHGAIRLHVMLQSTIHQVDVPIQILAVAFSHGSYRTQVAFKGLKAADQALLEEVFKNKASVPTGG